MTIRCSVCGKENSDDASVCARCGVGLVKTGITSDEALEIRFKGDERASIALEPAMYEGYVLGRSDEGSEYTPDVDLAPYGAKERGVSRRHAALIRFRGAVHLLDLQSVNGTYLNGIRLLPDTPYPLNVGDDIKLGHLSLVVLPVKK